MGQNPFSGGGGSPIGNPMGYAGGTGGNDPNTYTDPGTSGVPGYDNTAPNQQTAVTNQAQAQDVAEPPPPPATTAPGGQQSGDNTGGGGDDHAWLKNLGKMLYGSGAPTLAGAPEKAPYAANVEPNQPKGPGWFDPNAAPNNQPEPGTAVAARPPANAPMGTPTPQMPQPPMPFPTETADATPPAGFPDQNAAPVSPQSGSASGNKIPKTAPAAAAPAATTPVSPPDIAGSARESGGGPGISDRPVGGTPSAGATGAAPGLPNLGKALGDLLSLNIGGFLADLLGLGQQGTPGGTPGAAPGTAPGTAAGALPPEAQAEAGLPEEEQAGPGGAGSQNQYGLYPTSTGLTPTLDPRTGNVSSYPGQPGNLADRGFIGPAGGGATPPQGQPATAAAAPTSAGQRPAPGTAGASLPPAGSGGINRHEGPTGPGAPAGAMTGPPPAGVIDYTKQSGLRTHGQMGRVQGMVIHHTGPHINTVEDLTHTLQRRGLGVQFFIDRNGKTYQLAPDGQIMEHTRNGGTGTIGRRGLGLGNQNMEGVEIAAANDADVTPAQRQAAANLIQQRSQKYHWDMQKGVYGHGELNGHKEATEGMSVVRGIRDGSLRANLASAAPGQVAGPGAPGLAPWPTSENVRPVDPVARAMMSADRRGQPGLTRGDRNNNPGNIKMGPDAHQYGAVGHDAEGHAIFPTWGAGMQAQASLLKNRYNNMTVPEIQRHGYTPDRRWSEGVMRAGGFSPTQRLNLNDPQTLNRLQHAIWKQEGTHPPAPSQGRGGQLYSATGGGKPVAASSTTYEDELRRQGAANVTPQLGYVPGAATAETILRGTVIPTHMGKDFRKPSLAAQAGYGDVDRVGQ